MGVDSSLGRMDSKEVSTGMFIYICIFIIYNFICIYIYVLYRCIYICICTYVYINIHMKPPGLQQRCHQKRTSANG